MTIPRQSSLTLESLQDDSSHKECMPLVIMAHADTQQTKIHYKDANEDFTIFVKCAE
jgi:hypothetical protein